MEAKWYLNDSDCPRTWLNLAPVVKGRFPLPVIGENQKPATIDDLSAIYSRECALIELLEGLYGRDIHVPIPDAVMEEYLNYRPTPLVRARGMERALGYGGKILFKREDVNPSGSHKPNTAIPQAWYAKQQGLRGLITDTGAGQWGAAMAAACRSFGLDCIVFMTHGSYLSKPYRRHMMQLSGAKVYSSPSTQTESGRRLLSANPDHHGSLGIGMGEAMELVSGNPEVRLALGCMSYYAALHQTIVGQELSMQLEQAGIAPDILVACVGGGTNLIGFMSPFVLRKLQGTSAPDMVAAESANIPVLTTGEYRYDYADTFRLTPQIKMFTLGCDFQPAKIHAGGLRYHGKSSILSLMVLEEHIRAVSVSQSDAFSAGLLFFRSQGILPAPESGHAIHAVCEQVELAKSQGRTPTIVFCLSGTGYLDLQGYADELSLDHP